MKRFTCVLFLLITLCVSCQESFEKKVKRKVIDFVNLNYDNPKDFLEIVQILDNPDTFNAKKYISVVRETFELNDSLLKRNSAESLFNDVTSGKLYMPERNKKKSWPYMERILDLSRKQLEESKAHPRLSEEAKEFFTKVDSTTYETYISHTIRIRRRSVEGTKLDTLYYVTPIASEPFVTDFWLRFEELDEKSKSDIEQANELHNKIRPVLDIELEISRLIPTFMSFFVER